MSDPTPPRAPSFLDKLTLPGRLLLIATVLLSAAGFYWTFFFFAEHFPRGTYPLAFLCIPILIGAFAFFLLTAWLLQRCGLQIYQKPEHPDAKPPLPVAPDED